MNRLLGKGFSVHQVCLLAAASTTSRWLRKTTICGPPWAAIPNPKQEWR